MDKFQLKTPEEIKIMAAGGKLLGQIRNQLAASVKPGITGLDLENQAVTLINQTGGKASFKMVPGYHHATCININDVVVHGIPSNQIIQERDKVGIDIGLFYQGFHSDTAVTVVAGKAKPDQIKFLEIGRQALKKAINQAKAGRTISDLSTAMQNTVESGGYSVVRALTGHGIGRNLHENPSIPCYTLGDRKHSLQIVPGMVLAIEVMYNQGRSDVAYKNNDGWTIVTADGKISGLFEHTVAVTDSDPVILT